MPDNQFDHKGNGDQNIAQGNNAIGKKVDVDARDAQIEVGTPVTRRPPHRSRRAELPHRAPRSYSLRT